ncbi:hypothetical protein [Spongiactinospora sp. TRM90649]|uniref:hypothetical protein n=1 Tax=Spongiactinospora sp. TRM90649 TaxID=3031114 RepID=UPI0023F85744|nr:hypothetical protein [Spongiactinospora sp. TRM90649]MDF5757210.1 hypothetical protein [Spongiactinospora sp. TRM90649]
MTLDPDPRLPGRGVRAACGAVAGILLLTAIAVCVILGMVLFPDIAGCWDSECWPIYAQARWAAYILIWPLLYAMYVRPAWPVALLGAAFTEAVWDMARPFAWDRDLNSFYLLIALSAMIAYPIATLAAEPRLPLRYSVLPPAAFAVLYLLATAVE